ncbi:ABC transporter [Clostridia bacterium]|nr:ABC transporter [Clostridia bacterium]
MIQAKNLKLVYPDGAREKTVFDGVNLKIDEGERVVLVGPSGSGKSSLIYLLSLLKAPTAGRIYFDGRGCAAPADALKMRYERFGFIFQQHFLIGYLTVLENVLLSVKGADEKTRARACEILETLGLKEHLHKKPPCLSGGERQRAAIARALLKNPRVLFADEPTASLDHATAAAVMRMLNDAAAGKILITATHDLSLLQGGERVLRVADGRVTEN